MNTTPQIPTALREFTVTIAGKEHRELQGALHSEHGAPLQFNCVLQLLRLMERELEEQES